jgi:large subunit ribosomal protein L25
MSAALSSLTVKSRAATGTGAARATRREGFIPGVIYGSGKAPINVAVEPISLNKGLNTAGFYASLLELDVDGQKEKVLPKVVQFHPVSDAPLHIDFLRVDASTRITVSVPVKLLNQDKCRGLKIGGVLNVVRHNVEVNCPATNIPHGFEIDIANAKIGEAIKSNSITLPQGVKFVIADRDFTIATIAAPRGVSVDDEEAGS